MANSKANFQLIFKTRCGAGSCWCQHLVQEAEIIRECDIQALETEQQLKELDEVDLKHPIEFSGQELCSFAKEGKLKTKFKVTL